MIEHLNFYPSKKLLEEFIYKGGIVVKPNRADLIFKHISNNNIKKFFNRCHQKLHIIDDDIFIGSSNIAKEYSEHKFGKYSFVDLNMHIKNSVSLNSALQVFYKYLYENIDNVKIFNHQNYTLIMNNLNSLLNSPSNSDNKSTDIDYNCIKVLRNKGFLPGFSSKFNYMFKLLYLKPSCENATTKEYFVSDTKTDKSNIENESGQISNTNNPLLYFIRTNQAISNLICQGVNTYKLENKIVFRKIMFNKDKQTSIPTFPNWFKILGEKNEINNLKDDFFNINELDLTKEMFISEDPPEKADIQNTIFQMIKNAKNEIILIQPYYIRMKKLDNLLKDARSRGVKVGIITSYERDQPAYKHLYNRELFDHLIKEGVYVYEYMYKYLHMKAYYVDGKYLTIGSMNNDSTSFIMNNEANYYLTKDFTNVNNFKEFDIIVEKVLKNSRDVTSHFPKFNLFRWISNSWWRFFIFSMKKTVPNRKLD